MQLGSGGRAAERIGASRSSSAALRRPQKPAAAAPPLAAGRWQRSGAGSVAASLAASPASSRRARSRRRRVGATVAVQGLDLVTILSQHAHSHHPDLLRHVAAEGDLHLDSVQGSHALAAVVQQPVYEVVVQFKAAGRQLQEAERVWAHVGHSGWQDTHDIELFRSPQSEAEWTGIIRLPTSQLATPAHVEVQMVFKGLMPDGHLLWDNNDGSNWQVVAELSVNEGLVQPPPVCRTAVSGLLLLLQALLLKGLVSSQQEQLLRHLACQHDSKLLRAYDTVMRDRWTDEAAIAGLLIGATMLARRPGVHVMHVTSEMVPVAKVGGLGDVVTSLAKAHQASGTFVEIVMPKYDCACYGAIEQLRHLTTFNVWWAGKPIRTHAWCGVVLGLPVYLLEPEKPESGEKAFFWRGAFYGEPDDCERFMFFSRAALEFLLVAGKQPDVLHLHDWQSAMVAPLLDQEYRGRGLTRLRTLLTIHNIAFQGWMSADYLTKAGLNAGYLAQPHLMEDDSRPGFHPGQHDVSLLRGGVVFADRVTTVSPTYACEVFSPDFGFGMESVLTRHGHKWSGVLNGIDHQIYNPTDDWQLPAHFSAADSSGKETCKAALLAEVGLPYVEPDSCHDGVGRPLLVIISRLTQQKGLPLMLHGIKVALARGAQVIVLGSASEPEVHAQFQAMEAAHRHGGDARFLLRYDEGLAHRIYAGADMILIPSFFEPCGLTQLIALRYGTVPIVNQTGGLADTVRDVANAAVPECERNGFVFHGRGEGDVEWAVGRALDAYLDPPGNFWWRSELVPRCMLQDWSWSRSATTYLDLYRAALH